MSPPPHFIELAVRFASTPPFPDADAFVESCLKALGYDFGAFHLEFILIPAGPRVVELNARLVGILPAQLLVAHAIGAPLPPFDYTGAVTELRLTPPASGVLTGYEGLERAAAAPGCAAAGLYVEPGDRVSAELESNSQRVAYVQTIGASREDSYRAALGAARHIILHIDPG
jgi:hypothetical protein